MPTPAWQAAAESQSAAGGKPLERAPARRNLTQILPFLLFAWLIWVVASGYPHVALQVFPATVRLHLLYVALFAVYGAWLVYRRSLPGPTRLDLAVLAIVLAYAAAVAASIYPRISLETALLTGAVVVAFYVFSDTALTSVRALVRGLAATCLALAVLSLYEVAKDYGAWLSLLGDVKGNVGAGDLIPPTVPRVDGVGDHVNLLAMALNMTLPFALALLLRPQVRGDRPLGAIAFVLGGLALFCTLSRGAWLAFVPGMALFAALYLLRDRSLVPAEHARTAGRLLTAGALAGTALVLVFGAVLVWQWDSRPEWLFRSSLSPRYDAISVAVDIIKEKPILGSGPGTYGLLYNAYSGDYPIENIHPHNGYLNSLVALGIVGGAALLAAAAVVAYALAQAYQRREPETRILVAACAAALVTIALHSLVDSPNLSKTALLPMAVVVALSLRLAPPSATPRPRSPAAVLRLTPLFLAPLLALAWLLIDLPHSHYDRSLRLLREGDFNGSAAQAIEAAEADPHQVAYQVQVGVSQAIAYLVSSEPGGQPLPGLVDGAIGSLRAGLADEPRDATGHANLALALRLKGDRPGAAQAAREAMSLSPRDGTIAAVAGTVFEWADLQDEAMAAYARAVTHDAGLVQSPFWNDTPFRFGVRQQAIADSLLTDCQKGRVSAMFAGFGDDLAAWERGCRAKVGASPDDARARSDLAVILTRLGRKDEALAEARKAVSRASDNRYARTALGICLGATGARIEDVREQLLLATYLEDPDAPLLLAATYGNVDGGLLRRNLGLPSDATPLPAEVRGRLQDALPNAAPMVFDGGVQHYLLGVLYVRTRLLRESPTSVLIPGEWITFASPRTLLIQGMLASTSEEAR